ncbi:hypothetical protein SBI_02791 [Streptomyces bingchenggensis BCW-1]|uniref:Uncharacterized protein n=1 Tax=Streptomyces bingchenggensis (strain BCW-1) TaxID=749414 RepID=D7C2M9_STRBB|nr:hypothetical protein SBI_02791 [Streptomyces bingchenggensis BCW-1]
MGSSDVFHGFSGSSRNRKAPAHYRLRIDIRIETT